MTNLMNLIRLNCPEGVAFESIEVVCDFSRGKWIKADQLTPGPYPVVTSGQKVTEYHNEFNRHGETITIASSGAYAGFVNYWNCEIYLSNAFTVDSKDSNVLATRFLFHFLKNKQGFIHSLASGGGVPNVYGHDLHGIQIPIPPIEVQQEIVRILDQFTELEIQLEAELNARRLQFEHYRNYLMTFSEVDGL
jgi:type I restriction enzyme S subunit